MLHWPLLLLSLPVLLSSAQSASIQSPQARADRRRADAIRSSFQSAFADYQKYCFGHDQLDPLTKTCSDPLGGWGASVVDAATTAHVMGLNDIFDTTVAQSIKTDYTKTSSESISLFETNIRHIAGLLSAYELGGKKEQRLVNQAVIIGERLLQGWSDDNSLPHNTLLHWNEGPAPDTQKKAIIAETGTLVLEFDRLSKYSGNDTFRQYAVKAMEATINSSPLPFPGLNPQGIDAATAKPTDDYITWGGGSDSFFEYELKYAQLLGSQDTYMPAWITSVNSSIAHLLTTASGTTRSDLTYLADYSDSNGGLIPRASHLECFHGGNWMLGGKLLGNNDIFQIGLSLTEACYNTYASSATGIGPESFVFRSASGSTNRVKITDEAFYAAHGFDYDAKSYVLRPEVLESVFYAYRLTGDRKWQDRAWAAYQSLVKYCKAPASLAAIDDVTNVNTKQLDDSESFLYAELFKYLYLTFASPDTLSLDKYVFNTEAHPFELDHPGFDFASLNPGASLAKPQNTKAFGGSLSTSSTDKEPTPATAFPLPVYSSNPKAASLRHSIIQKVLGIGGVLKRSSAVKADE